MKLVRKTNRLLDLVVDGEISAFEVGTYRYWSRPNQYARGKMQRVYYALPPGVYGLYDRGGRVPGALRADTQKALLNQLARRGQAMIEMCQALAAFGKV